MVTMLPSRQRALSWFVRRVARFGAVHLAEFGPVDALDASTRARLGPQIFAIFQRSYGALSAEVVLDEIVFKPGGYLGLYHDRHGSCVGFSVIKAEPLVAAGRRCTSLAASAYFLPVHRGGRAAGRLGLAFALVEKLRHPWRPLVYAFELLSPISYLRGTKIFAQFYPHRALETPALIAAISEAVIDARGLIRVDDRPDVVRYEDPARHEREVPEALRSDDPEVQFYLDHNPDYRRGHILIGIAPMTALNILASTTVTTMAWLRAATPRPTPRTHNVAR